MEEGGSICSAGDCGDCAVWLHRRRSREATVELAVADALRLATDYLLASLWNSGSVPHPLRRIWTPRLRPLQLSSPHGRALGAYDAGRARASAAKLARTL